MRPIPDQDSTIFRRRSVTTSNPKWSWGLRAVALASLLCASQVQALSLGKVSVLSALGEPLVAEIDVPQISAEEEASLKVGVASTDAFKAAGVDFSSALAGAQIKLHRRSNGRLFLRLESNRTVNEPFLDLILEANWASGRIVRDYTLLLDPPNTRSSVPPPLSATVSDPSLSKPAQKPTPAAPVLPSSQPTPVQPVPVATAPSEAPKKSTTPPASPPPSQADAGSSNTTITTKVGDTAVKLASGNKPAHASLDQMLVAMLRANPQAFVKGNINRLRAGVAVEIPNETTVGAISNKEAKEILATQSRDFSEFRRRLAGMTTAAPATPVERQVTGKINEVKVKSSSNASPDKLTLSKPDAKSGQVAPTKEDDIAKDLQVKDANARKEELAKNIADLTKIATTASVPKGTTASAPATTAPAPAPAASTTATPPAAPAPAAAGPAPTPAPVSAAATPAPSTPAATTPAPASANAPVAASPATTAPPPPAEGAQNTPSTSAPPAEAPVAAPSPAATEAPPAPPPLPTPPAAEPPKPKPVPPPPPPIEEEPSFIDGLIEEPWVLPAGGVLLAGVLGAVAWRIRSRQREKGVAADSSFLESRLQPDSFFGASGGQNVDTAEAGSPAASSMMYSPSQLDAGGDVDPVAEADVYLAYGRDLQAEEILKEALRTDPQRVAIHCKLLDIYAKRHDVKAFEVLAYEVYSLTQGMGPEWEGVCELGRELAPENPLYRPGGMPQTGMSSPSMLQTQPHSLAATQRFVPQHDASSTDLDLDLDFSDESVGEPAAGASTPNAQYQPAHSEHENHPEELSFTTTSADSRLPTFGNVDFSASPPPLPAVPPLAPGEKLSAHRVNQIHPFAAPATTQPPASSPVQEPAHSLDFDANALEFSLDETASPPPSATPPAAAPQSASAKDDFGFEMLEFDMGDLSRSASNTSTNSAIIGAPTGPGDFMDMEMLGAEVIHATEDDDPLETKLSLAAEFLAIGDNDAARSLAEEVVEQATGALQKKASKFLSDMA